jgi:hypothetical protein
MSSQEWGINAKDPKDHMYYPQSPEGHTCFVYGPGDPYSNHHRLANDLGLAKNRALGWFKDELGSQASLGVTILQYKEAFQMIEKRALQMARFLVSLKKLDFVSAWRALELKDPKANAKLRAKEARLKSGAKHYASNVLEVNFGWRPLVGDIFSAIDTIQSPIPLGKVVGVGSIPFDITVTQNESALGLYTKILNSVHKGKIRVRCGAEVQVSNPNLYLANRLGLTNPAMWAYELIPFSFVANWFYSVEDFLSQLGQFAGLDIINPWTSIRVNDMCTSSFNYSYPAVNEYGGHTVVSASSCFVRESGLPDASIVKKRAWLTSPARAANAISLLILKGFKT